MTLEELREQLTDRGSTYAVFRIINKESLSGFLEANNGVLREPIPYLIIFYGDSPDDNVCLRLMNDAGAMTLDLNDIEEDKWDENTWYYYGGPIYEHDDLGTNAPDEA